MTENNSLSNRIPALDLARVIAIIMMIQGHTLDTLLSPNLINIEQFPWNIWHFFRGVTAPIFLIISGIVHVFANKRDENGRLFKSTFIKRIRFSLIMIFTGYFVALPANNIYNMIFVSEQNWLLFSRVNILQFFGISLLVYILVFYYTNNERQFRITALTMALIITFFSPFVQILNWYEFTPKMLAAYFSFDYGSMFTLFPFLAYMLIGGAIGTILKQYQHKEREIIILKYFPIYAIALISAGYGLHLLFSLINHVYANPNNADFGMVFIRSGFALIFICIAILIKQYFGKISEFFAKFGQKAMYVYIIHLYVLYGTSDFPGIGRVLAKSLSFQQAFLYIFFVIITTLIITYLLITLLRRDERNKLYFKYFLVVYIVAVLFL